MAMGRGTPVCSSVSAELNAFGRRILSRECGILILPKLRESEKIVRNEIIRL